MKSFLKRLLIFVTFPIWTTLALVYLVLSLFGIVWVFTGKAGVFAQDDVLDRVGTQVVDWIKS